MRFESFQLARFGHFTDQVLAFPAPTQGGPDLHVIAGMNEAGKSTFRTAVGELLFGFNERTPYAFRHAYPELLLGAVIRDGEAVESLLRAKKRNHSLSRPDGSPLPDSHLARMLGGLDKIAYARQFALDHEMLVEGGKRLLESRSDLSQLLFEAASGIAEFAALQRELDAQAGQLWKKDGRAKTAFREAARSFDLANRAKRVAVTTGGAYDKLRREFDASEEARDQARATVVELERQRAGLERLRRTAPLITKLDDLDREIAQRSPPESPAPRLPEDATQQLGEIRRRDALLREAIDRTSKQQEALRQQIESQDLDHAILSQAASIEALAEQRARVQELPLHIDHRRREVAGLEEQGLSQARQIGWSSRSRSDLWDRLPPALRRNELRVLLQQRPALEERVTNRRSGLASLEDDYAALKAKLSVLPSGDPGEVLTDAIEQARRLGDIDLQRQDLTRNSEGARNRLESLRLALRPWSGDWDQLRDLTVVSLEETEDQLRGHGELTQELTAQKKRDTEINAKLQVAEAELEARRRQHEIVDRATLQHARAERDALWRSIREGETEPSSAAETYERQVLGADELADRRFDSAEAISQADQLATAIARLRAELQAAQAGRDRLQAEIDQRTLEWSQTLEKLALDQLPPVQYRAWLDSHRQALQALETYDQTIADSRAFERRCEAAAQALRDALGEIACGAKDGQSGGSLIALLRLGVARVEEAQRVSGERKQGETASLAFEQRLITARREVSAADQHWQDWQERWGKSLTACGLPKECSPEVAEDALERMTRIETILTDIERLETDRIEKMAQDLEGYARAAQRLAEDLDPDLADRDPNEISQTLSARLAAARVAETRHRELVAQFERVGREFAEAGTGLDRLRAELSPLMTAAAISDLSDLDGLGRIVGVSNQLRELERQRRSVRDDLIAAAEGETIETLRNALVETPAAERELRSEELDREQAEARKELEDSTERWTEARAALKAISAGDSFGSGAARAEQDRQDAIANLASIAGEFIEAHLKAKLLRWAIDRYGADFRSPLLARASALFRTLTLASYEELLIDLEPESPTLLARTANGAAIGLEGLSDGTRDQLYMALRIAAVELHLDQATPLPFIADDLMINFDNDRATAAFHVLAELGARTQVFYLSHHDHLVALAGKALGRSLNVIRL